MAFDFDRDLVHCLPEPQRFARRLTRDDVERAPRNRDKSPCGGTAKCSGFPALPWSRDGPHGANGAVTAAASPGDSRPCPSLGLPRAQA